MESRPGLALSFGGTGSNLMEHPLLSRSNVMLGHSASRKWANISLKVAPTDEQHK